MLAAMKATATIAKKKYGNFAVYTDSSSEYWLAQIMPDMEICVVDTAVFDQHDTAFYSKCKIFTYLKQTDAFLHLDLDFLLGPEWNLDLLDKHSLVGQWWEDVNDARAALYYNWSSESTTLTLPENMHSVDANAPALNTGCLWVKDIEFIHQYANTVLHLVDQNYQAGIHALSVPTLEQHVLGMLIKKFNIATGVLIQPDEPYLPVNNRFIHFLGKRWKNRNLPLADSVLSQVLNSWIDQDLQDLAIRLNRQRALIADQ